ncbi:MAG: tetratricopeptide repeat protein [Acidobacteriota bacterium]|nr:tetratricopeptide repeat protein [Acidobacteriota bacterium]
MLFAGSVAAATLLLAGAVSNFVQEGRRNYAANKFPEAAVQFQKAIKANPSDRNARLWLGYAYLAMDDLEAALRNLEPLRESMSSDAEYLYAISEAYTRCARRFSERIAELGDRSARAHEILAYRYRAVGQPRSAVAELRQAARLRPGLAGLHLEAAEILWQEGQYDEAASELRTELQIAPKDFLSNLRYGQYLLRTRDYRSAIQPLTIAAGYRKYPEAYELAAYAWEKLGGSEDRIAALRAGLDVFPADANLAGTYRRCLAENPSASTRKWSPPLLQEEAAPNVPELCAALSRNPRDEDVLFSLSRVYSAKGQSFFEQLERAAPGSYRVLQVKGLNAEYAEDFEQASSYYRQVAAAQSRLAGAHYSLGHVLRKLGKEEEGLIEIANELEIDPQNYLACYELGSGWLGRGDAAQAVPMLRRALALRPDFLEAKTDLAKAFVQLKQPGDAIGILKSVISKKPDHPTAHFLLYRAYAALGSADLAKKELSIHQELLQIQRERNKQ